MNSIDNDARLMLEFKDGDDEAFSKIIDKYTSIIINFIYHFTSDYHSAEDLAQEVFLRVYQFRDKYEPRAKFSTWLYGIATNICLDFKRKTKRDLCEQAESLTYQQSDHEGVTLEIPDTTNKSIESSLEQSEIDAKVRSALASLPDNQRLAITLKVYEDESYEQIAKILECSIPAVESLIFRARQALKQKLIAVSKEMEYKK